MKNLNNMMNNVIVVYACRCKHRHIIGGIVLFWNIELYFRLLTHDRDWETHCSRGIQTSWLHVVVSSCFSIPYPAYWKSEGVEWWTTTTAVQEEMGRKNGDAVRIMLGERKQETMESGYTWIGVQNGVGENLEKTVRILLFTTWYGRLYRTCLVVESKRKTGSLL